VVAATSQPLDAGLSEHRRRPAPWAAAALIGVVVAACALYANLAFLMTDPHNYRFFPPFRPNENAIGSRHPGYEYFHIAQSLREGKGFANPFVDATGPTAWMPPLLPSILAACLWIGGDRPETVAAMVSVVQACVLVGTGLLVLALARRVAPIVEPWLVAAAFAAAVVSDFHYWFQRIFDGWLVLVVIDLLIICCFWLPPLATWKNASAWGLCGGLCLLINPVLGGSWALLSLCNTNHDRAWRRLPLATLLALLVIAPWTVRNYLVFGRWIPVKSNLVYELYQSQCLQSDGLLQMDTMNSFHPHHRTPEGRQYRRMGEMAYLDLKRAQFYQAVADDPLEFADRVANRFLGATLWYRPVHRADESRRPWITWLSRAVHPLPFVAFLILAFSTLHQPLERALWIVMAIYVSYLLPYVVISYYDRYGLPLLGVKVLLVLGAVERVAAIWPKRQAISVTIR
jgi:hypothetical protein